MKNTHTKTLRAVLAVAVLAASALGSASVEAKGCLKGAAVGGTAGHFAGRHAVLGAAGGCLVGRHYANKRDRQQAAQANGTAPQQPTTYNDTATAPAR